MEAAFRECVNDERHDGRTILLSSHILAEAEALSDRVTIIRAGRAVETGTLAEMRHLTRDLVDAELAGPVSLDGLPGVHDLVTDGLRVRCEVDHAALDEVLARLHRGRRPVPHLPAADPRGAVPASLFFRTDRGRSAAMTVLAHPGRAAGGLTGTGELAKLALRRDRIALPAAVYVIAVLVAGTAETFKRLYPTAAGRAALAATGAGNPALRFLYSRIYGNSLGSLTTWRYGIWAGIFAALMAIFVVIRHTRSDEEAGRLELVGSAAVGRQAALAAALATAAVASVGVTGPAVRPAAVDRPARGRLGPARRWPSAAARWPSPGSPPWPPS